jgi:hypothetical protein
LGGSDDYIISETKYINSEISALKYNEAYKNRQDHYVSIEFVKNLKKKYREENNKEQTIINNQKKRLVTFSVVMIITSLIYIFFLNGGNGYLISLSLPHILFFGKLFQITGGIDYRFLIFPFLIIFCSLIILFIKRLVKTRRLK